MKKFFSTQKDSELREKLITKEKEQTDRLEEDRQKARQELRDLERVAVERQRVEEEIIKSAEKQKEQAEEKERLLRTNLMKF